MSDGNVKSPVWPPPPPPPKSFVAVTMAGIIGIVAVVGEFAWVTKSLADIYYKRGEQRPESPSAI